MTDPVMNTQMLDLVMNFIETHPEQHDQESWVDVKPDYSAENEYCGTTACFAGHALLMSGMFDLKVEKTYYGDLEAKIVNPDTGDEVFDFEGEGRKVLGLNSDEAGALFDGDNERDDLSRIVEEIKAGEYR